jgi:hypothetical protein
MIRVSASVLLHPTFDPKQLPHYITISITNVGNLPALIPLSFFRWKVPFRTGTWAINPWDYRQHDPLVPQRQYPAEIKPRGSVTVFLTDLAGFRTTMAEAFNEVRLSRWRLRFVRAIVITEDGRVFKAKVDKEIRRELAKVRSTAKAIDHV